MILFLCINAFETIGLQFVQCVFERFQAIRIGNGDGVGISESYCSTEKAVFVYICVEALESLLSYLHNGTSRTKIGSILTKIWPIPFLMAY